MQKKPDEFVPLQWRAVAWMCYVCTVCGCINGMSLSELFQTPVTHFTGITTRAAENLQKELHRNSVCFRLQAIQ